MFVGLSVCFLSATRDFLLCGAASEWPRAGSAVVASGPARAGKCMHVHSESTRAHAVQLLNEKITALMHFKNKNVRARMLSYTRLPRFSKRKPTCHFPSSVFSLPSLGVFTFRIVLNRILHKSSLLAPMESRRTRRPTFTAEERLERRREQDRRPATCRNASTAKTGADTGPEGCGAPAVFPSPCLDLQRLQS